MAESRAKNSVRNSVFGLAFKLLNIVGAFIARTLLIYFLGVEYVGLDGLFTSVLTLLSLAEVGFNTAIVYKLYKPIAENDVETVCSYLNLYKRIYRAIGVIVFVLGIAILPFLKHFIKGDVPDDINIYLLFLIYLANSCLSYWLFAYKTAILSANQREDLPNKVNCIATIIKYSLQIVLLFCFRNYYLFIIIIPLITVFTNLGNAYLANRYFPQYQCRGGISDENKNDIKQNIKALLYNKIGVVIITGSDNIIISSFLGLTILGVYDSYYYIYSMIYSVFAIMYNSITPSIGNSIVKESNSQNLLLFDRFCFVNFWAVTIASVTLFCLYNPFIQLWLGEEKAFDNTFSLIMALYLFFWLYRFAVLIFKNALGLWWPDRYRAIIEAFCNVILNLILVQYIGIYGIMLSTLISCLVVSVPWEARVLFKKYFLISPTNYFFIFIKRFILVIAIGSMSFSLCELFCKETTIVNLCIRLFICFFSSNIVLYIIYRNDTNFHYLKLQIKRLLCYRK